MNHPRQVHAEELHKRITAGERCVLVDVRTAEEYRALHADGALLLTLDQCTSEALSKRLTEAGYDTQTPLYFICHTGQRATEAADAVLAQFPHAAIVQGGTLAWAQAGLPVKPGDQP